MKKNCLFIFDHPCGDRDGVPAMLEDFFRELRSTHYVYVAEPGRDEIEDSPGGARFLRWSDSLVESFGNLSTIVIANNEKLYKDLRDKVSPSTQFISLDFSGDSQRAIRKLTELFLRTSLSNQSVLSKKAA